MTAAAPARVIWIYYLDLFGYAARVDFIMKNQVFLSFDNSALILSPLDVLSLQFGRSFVCLHFSLSLLDNWWWLASEREFRPNGPTIQTTTDTIRRERELQNLSTTKKRMKTDQANRTEDPATKRDFIEVK